MRLFLWRLAGRVRSFYGVVENRNILLQIASTMAVSCGALMATNTYIQDYMVASGMSNLQIGMVGTVDSISMMVGFFCVMGIVSRVRRIAKANAIATLFYAAVPLAIALSALLGGRGLHWILLCGIYILQNLGLAFKQTVSSKSIVDFIPQPSISRVMSVSSLTGYLLGIAVGGFVTLLAWIAFPYRFALIFSMAVLLFLLGAWLCSRLQVLHESAQPVDSRPASPFAAIHGLWQRRRSRVMLICHAFRGTSMAAMFYVMVVALKNIPHGQGFSSHAFIVANIASVLGSILFGLLGRRVKTRAFYVAGTTISGVCMVLCAMSRSPQLFLLLYFGVVLGGFLTDISVPVGVYFNIDPADLPAMAAARQFVSAAVKAGAVSLVGLLLGVMPVPLLFALLALAQITGALLYYVTFKRDECVPE